MSEVLVLSIKPEFVEKIFSGKKKIELRKAAPNVCPGDFVFIYSTRPVKAVIGFCQVQEIIKMSPIRMWRMYRKHLGIDKKRFLQYYENIDTAVGIVLTSVIEFNEAIPLNYLKKKHPPFQPPQTFRYYQKSLFLSPTSRNEYTFSQAS